MKPLKGLSRGTDRIFLEGLEVRCVIGIFGWERGVKQKVSIDLEFPADARRAAVSDQIGDTVNYKEIVKLLLREISKSRFQLIESLAEFIADLCLQKFNLGEIAVRVSKPGAIRGSRNVGIFITRKRNWKTRRRGFRGKI